MYSLTQTGSLPWGKAHLDKVLQRCLYGRCAEKGVVIPGVKGSIDVEA